ncbi:MAG TPA: cellulose synthase family protein, partial [Candidatus Methylomirabilis sp.]|nr:cellulose synthase family protein [Candidatus Methylomirabilis sp.]
MHTALLLSVILAQQNPIRHYWHKITDRTFAGIYHANAFDLAMMIPYFLVLCVLALYGLHRYWLVYDYYKYSKNVPGPPFPVSIWPRVTIQLPIYNERYVIERLVEAVSRFDYPPELLDVQVLDDSTDETQQVARACVERHAAQGMHITYTHRANREGYKAGALENGLKTAQGEFVAIFDADFIPEHDFLRRTIPYFLNPSDGGKIGMVQARWTYLNRDYSLLTQVETILLDGHFVVEHGARSRRGTFFNFNGTAGVWRRQAIEDAGGWEHDTLTEDTDLSYRAQLHGWKFLYLPDIECASELPVDMNGFKAQQARWAKGLMQTAKKILPRVLKSDAPWHVKAEAFFHLTANISYPLMVLLSTMLLPVMVVRFQQGWFQMLLIDLPLFLASTCSISSFYLVAQKELRPNTWRRTFLYMPFVMATGIGISVRNAQAVIEAIVGRKSEFARTPKFKIEGKKDSFAKKSYRNKAGWMPYAEVLLGIYFAFTVVYAITNEN